MNKIIINLFLIILIKCVFMIDYGNTKEINNFKNNNYLLKKIKPDIEFLLNKQKGNGHKIENIDEFLSYWNILRNNQNYELTKDPFTIFIPKLDETQTIQKEFITEFLLEHLVPGIAFKTLNENEIYGTSNKNAIIFQKYINNHNSSDVKWFLNNNNIKIIKIELITDNLTLIFIDGYLGDTKSYIETGSYNNNRNSHIITPKLGELKTNLNDNKNYNKGKSDDDIIKENRVKYLINFLSGMKLGTKVFQHFLNKSNLGELLADNHQYTILIPIDNAFQRWHPIDWGFYPFSVQEFTESVLRNHFIQMKIPLKMENFKNMNQDKEYKTLGGETVIFRNHPMPNVNNVTILSDYTLPNGNEVFLISEVLFVSEAIVSRLHQMHKDKETPPLLAFPWFGAQFLSHAFLALERDSRFTQITRFLNTVEIAQYISGSNYTFFVPIDSAFEKLGFNNLADEILSTEKVSKMLLNHFIKGRLYDRDLKNDELFEGLGGGYLKIHRKENGSVTINNAKIIESEVFVYNLGTMFFIDEILYSEILTSKYTIPSKRATNEHSTVSSVVTNLNDQFTTIYSYDGDYRRHLKENFVPNPDVEDVTAKEQNDMEQIPSVPRSSNEEEDEDDLIETETPKALPQISNLNNMK